MRFVLAVIVGSFIAWAGILFASASMSQWTLDMWNAARIPPEPGHFLPQYDGSMVAYLVTISYGLEAFWAFSGGLAAGLINPVRAYRCAIALCLLSFAEYVLMRWYLQSAMGFSYGSLGWLVYLFEVPKFITRSGAVFLGALLSRRLLRKKVAMLA
jgi:hypothetical protein